MDRREFIRRAGLAAIFTAVGSLSVFEAMDKLAQSRRSPASNTIAPVSQTQQAPQGYVLVASMSALAGKTSAYFNHPTGGLSILIDYGGSWRAFSAICTHAGCTVQFTGSEIYCPCHAGAFSATNGSVTAGPPPSPLPEYPVLVQNGNLYVGK